MKKVVADPVFRKREEFHSSDDAVKDKRNAFARPLSVVENETDKILRQRELARKFPEVNAEGRTASYDYLGVKRWYDENGVDEDGFLRMEKVRRRANLTETVGDMRIARE